MISKNAKDNFVIFFLRWIFDVFMNLHVEHYLRMFAGRGQRN